MKIHEYGFDGKEIENIKSDKYGSNWPVVYIINNEKEAYVGETLDAARRMSQHLQNPDRHGLKKLNLICDDTFNKSVILDLESFLIKYMSSDEKFQLQNGNGGVSDYDYYRRSRYERGFPFVWEELRKRGLARKSLEEIRNSDLFKYSPYKSLTEEQLDALRDILDAIQEERTSRRRTSIVVEGGAGTGKTVLAVFLMKLLADTDVNAEEYDSEEEPWMQDAVRQLGKMKVGLVVPMQSLRKTITQVFKSMKGLSPDMILRPNDVVGKHYDLLIVDEAHRLKQRRALAQYPIFDRGNNYYGLGTDGTELDWIRLSSDIQLLFYDPKQSVKPADIDRDKFWGILDTGNCKVVELKSQLRCLGGNDYVNYISSILSNQPPREKITFDRYDFQLFTDVQAMIDAIKRKDQEFGLCRTVAGFSWPWVTKNKKVLNSGVKDISIDGNSYLWNTTAKDWINSKNSINEIGCIHTVQGYDLNYAGVIFGNEIRYDPVKKEIFVDKSSYYDNTGKTALRSLEELKSYIINIYTTLMTRGIRGTYLYICDDNLRQYMSQFIDMADTIPDSARGFGMSDSKISEQMAEQMAGQIEWDFGIAAEETVKYGEKDK